MTTFPMIAYDLLPPPLSTHPYLLFYTLAIILIIIILTRLTTTLKFHLHSPTALTPPILPYSIPLLGHIPSMTGDLQCYLLSKAKQYPILPAFSLIVGNTKHHILTSPSLVQQVLLKRENFNKISMKPMISRLIQTFGGDHKREMEKTVPEDVLFGPIHGVLVDMMREEFVTTALAGTVKAVEDTVPNLISGVSSPIDMEVWERAGHVELLPSSSRSLSSSTRVAEADLFPLLRDLVGQIATTILMSPDFLANYPTYLSDLWISEPFIPLCMAGVPDWFPSMQAPMAARNRITAAVAAHQAAYRKFHRGEDPGVEWSGIGATSSIMRDRILAWEKAGASVPVAARGDAQVLMALNINAPAVVFWLVWHIFSSSSPTLLRDLREELTPYVSLPAPSSTTGIPEREKLKIDLDGLRHNCPLLKGAYLETMRMEATSLSYKYIAEDILIRESASDAAIFGRPSEGERREYVLRKGEYVCIPGIAHNYDGRYFEQPERFDARRFWTTSDGKPWSSSSSRVGDDDHETSEKKKNHGGDGGDAVDGDGGDERNIKDPKSVKIDYRTMKPWGGGKEICKGRTFAEAEVLVFAAAIIMLWDIEPVEENWEWWYAGLGEDFGGVLKMQSSGKENKDQEKRRGEWKHPGRRHGAGAATPVGGLGARVRISRRAVREKGRVEDKRERRET